MRAFFGGQIKLESRGDLAVVVTAEEGRYSIFMYPPFSEEFNHLTGVRSVQSPVQTVYIGISHQAGEEIMKRAQDGNITKLPLRSLDELVVIPYFLDKNQEKPNRVVLEATRDGYKVVD